MLLHDNFCFAVRLNITGIIMQDQVESCMQITQAAVASVQYAAFRGMTNRLNIMTIGRYDKSGIIIFAVGS